MKKVDFRQWACAKRKEMSVEQRVVADAAIFNQLKKMGEFGDLEIVMCYVSFAGEVDTHRIIKYWLAAGMRVCVPKVNVGVKSMVGVEIKDFDRDLVVGAYGILEPNDSCVCVVDLADISLVVLPGLVFDRVGNRIGFGGGFYDKFLAQFPEGTKFVGLAYDWQVVDELEADDWDVAVSVISD